MFEQASRMKLRFDTAKGQVTVEDLWDMPLIDLDNAAVAYRTQVKKKDNKSFLSVNKQVDPTLKLRLSIMKHIIETRIDEEMKSQQKVIDGQYNAKIDDLIEAQKDKVLKKLSIEELIDLKR